MTRIMSLWNQKYKENHKAPLKSQPYIRNEKYEGVLKNGLREGWDIYHYRNGALYKGEWIEGKKHGVGIMKYANGDRYEDNWNGEKQGLGSYTHADGRQYYGN
jgi:hypothetical protein